MRKAATLYFAIALFLTGCEYEQFTPETDSTHRIEGTGSFDFSTLDNANFAVDYGAEYGQKALLEVYVEDPSNEGVEAVFKTFLNEKGQYVGTLNLASWVNQLWLYTPTLGPSSLVNVRIEDGNAQYVCKAELLEDPKEVQLPIVQSSYEILAYEDMISSVDFDMNDVVLKHRRDIIFGSSSFDNHLKVVADYYQNYNCGADNQNAFAFEYSTQYLNSSDVKLAFYYTDDPIDIQDASSSTVQWTECGPADEYVSTVVRKGDDVDCFRKSYVLISDCRKHVGRTYRVERTFAGSYEKQKFEEQVETLEKLNPFIICEYNLVTNDKYDEIHVVGGSLTERAKNTNGWSDYFTVSTSDGERQYPYALRILGEISWDLVTPGVRIDKEYPDFQKWIWTRLNNPSDISYNLWYKNKAIIE